MKKTELPRGLRNNNPGNIRRNSNVFQGEKIPSSDRQFKQFKTLAYGYRAVFKILTNLLQFFPMLRVLERIVIFAI